MVLTPFAYTLNTPCCASVEECEEAAAEPDPEDTGGYHEHAAQVRVEFIKGFNSAMLLPGDTVIARLMEDMKLQNGAMMAQKGSRIYGRVETVNRSKKLFERSKKSKKGDEKPLSRHASVVVRFDKIVTTQKAKLEIYGVAAPQYNVFSNGQTVRTLMVGGDGEVLKTESADFTGVTEFGLTVPKDWVKFRGRYQVEVKPGDEMLVDVDLGPHGEVEGQIVGSKKDSGTK
jgi:hypothetical protein